MNSPAPNTPAPKSRKDKLRQALLLLVLGGMTLYFGGQWLHTRLVATPIDEAKSKSVRLAKSIKSRQDLIKQVSAMSRVLPVWNRQSLPADTELARSFYQAWLVQLVEDVGLKNPSVSSSEPLLREGVYYSLNFAVRCRGTLEQLTQFLFVFYRTDMLHQIRSVNITPLAGGKQLDVSLAVEAISLTEVARSRSEGETEEDQAAVFAAFQERIARTSSRLASDDLEAYGLIVQRNLFATGGGDPADPVEHAYLTSINYVDGEPEAWFSVRSTDALVTCRVGERVAIGTLEFELVDSFDTEIVIDVDGERWLLSIGDRLTDAFALPPVW